MAQNHHKLPKSSTSKNAAILYFFTTELELKIYNLFNGVITVIHRSAFSFVIFIFENEGNAKSSILGRYAADMGSHKIGTKYF